MSAAEPYKIMVRLDPVLHRKMKHIAHLQRKSVNGLVVDAIVAHVADIIYENPTYEDLIAMIETSRGEK